MSSTATATAPEGSAELAALLAKLVRSNGSTFSVVYTRSKRPLRKKEATPA